MSSFTSVNALFSQNQYCLMMIPIWISEAEEKIRSISENDALCSKVRLKYVFSRIPTEFKVSDVSVHKFDSLEEFVDFVSPYLFEAGDAVEIENFGTSKIYRYQGIAKIKDKTYVAFDDGDCDVVYFSAQKLRNAQISKISDLPKDFDVRKKERQEMLAQLKNKPPKSIIHLSDRSYRRIYPKNVNLA